MKVVIIDNYDSFTYNLSHLVKELGADVTVFRNDQFAMAQLEPFDKIILSPGPGIPNEAGLLLEVIKHYAGKKPILGVCLGEQAIGEFFGGKLVNLTEVFHGVQTNTTITDPEDYLFDGLPRQIQVGRYHSWVVDAHDLPSCLIATAVSDEGQVMALRHKDFDVHGIQFHPESVLTPEGKTILSNWLHHVDTSMFFTPADHKNFMVKKMMGELPNCTPTDTSLAIIAPGGGGPETPHTHPHNHLFIVEEGVASVYQDGQKTVVGKDEAILVQGNKPHAVWNEGQTELKMIGITLK